MSNKPESRRATRHGVEIAATAIIAGQERETCIFNLSLGGAFLDHAERLPIGTRIRVRFRIPTQEDPIEADAQVRWTSERGVGVQFDGLRAREVWSLNKFFEQLS